MATFKVETQNKVDIEKKPRVYFTCHPDDFEKYFKKICGDIFKTHDCAVYYTEDMAETIAEDEKDTDLGRNNLFVVPVTLKLLSTPNRAMDEDIPFALKKHIPVLPIMMETRIDSIYSAPDKFGELQYLYPFSTDPTEISYEEKLKKYLNSVLISNELANRVRAAFYAHIFLSYRKKDRNYANRLMRLIHNNPECRDIAIWFDEFLTPGESFKENIKKNLSDCNLFTLLVTPRIFEKVVTDDGEEVDNYVISTELPLARENKKKKGTDILAVEMEETDKNRLRETGLDDCVSPAEKAFRDRLLETIRKIAITESTTPEHNFLIGLAYLNGIEVETDYNRAIELITSAADEDLLEAMHHLWYIHSDGKNLDFSKSVQWAERIADYHMRYKGQMDCDTLEAQHVLAREYGKSGNKQKELEISKNVYKLQCELLGETHESTLETLNDIANCLYTMDEYDEALKLHKKIYSLRKDALGENHPDTLMSLTNLGSIYNFISDYKNALFYRKTSYELGCITNGEKHTLTLIATDNLADTYNKLGMFYEELQYRRKAYAGFNEVLGAEHPHTLIALDNLAGAYSNYKNTKRALKLRKEAHEHFCKILGEDHPETLVSLNNLAGAYGDDGDYAQALKLHTEAYNALCKVLGEYHSSTLMALNGIGFVLGKLNRNEESLASRKKEYELRCKTLGETNKETLSSLNNVACAYGRLGDHEKALKLHKQVHELRKKTLGEKHLETLESLKNIKNTQEILNIKKH